MHLDNIGNIPKRITRGSIINTTLKHLVFWDVAKYSLVGVYQCSERLRNIPADTQKILTTRYVMILDIDTSVRHMSKIIRYKISASPYHVNSPYH
jgi:hypothetical protein